jgi:S1-C subfamily serine protease
LQSYAQATLTQGTIKGFILSGPSEKAHLLTRIVAKMRASFKPLGARALDPALAILDDSTRSGLISGLEPRKPHLSRSGFFVDASGRVATTTEAVMQCRKITLNHDTPAHLLHADRDSGLAILAPDQALAPRGIASLQSEPPREGAEIVTSGYSYGDRLPAPVLTFGVVTETAGLAGEDYLRRLAIPVLAGDAGGPVLGLDGAVIGLLLPRNTDQPRKLPEGVSFALTAATLSQQLQAAGITPATHQAADRPSPDALAGLATDMTVLVSCWD